MLGAARASEYAGWWNQGIKSISFSSTSSVTPYIVRPTAYSWAIHDVNSGTITSSNLSPSATLDITPISGYSTYNKLRMNMVYSVYLDGTTWGSWASPNGQMWTGRHVFVDNSSNQYSFSTSLGISSSKLSYSSEFGGGGGAQIYSSTTDAATNYFNKWLTVVASGAETSSVYTNWTGGTPSGSQNMAMRVAIYNTETGALLVKTDSWGYASTLLPLDWATGFSSPLTSGQSGSPNTFYTNCFGAGADTDTGNPLTPMGAYWCSMGTMFDPVSSTDTSWLTSCPAQQIGNAHAVIQSQYIGYVAGSGGAYYNQTPAGRSLYSQSSNYDWICTPYNNANASIMYSSTIRIRNS